MFQIVSLRWLRREKLRIEFGNKGQGKDVLERLKEEKRERLFFIF